MLRFYKNTNLWFSSRLDPLFLFLLGEVVDWHCDVSPQIHRLIPNPQYLQMWLFEGRVSEEVIRWKGARSMDPNIIWPVSLQKEAITTQMHTEEWPSEDAGRRRPCAHWGERPPKKPTLPTPWSWTSNSWNCEKINCLLFKPPYLWCFAMANRAIQYREWMISPS